MGRSENRKQKFINKNVLERHGSSYDPKMGVGLINDFMQLSQILESLKETNPRAFNAMYALIDENIELKATVRERGERISKLQRGQTQPK